MIKTCLSVRLFALCFVLAWRTSIYLQWLYTQNVETKGHLLCCIYVCCCSQHSCWDKVAHVDRLYSHDSNICCMWCGISRGSPFWFHLAFPNEHRQWCSATVVVDSNSFDVVLQFRPGVPVVRGMLVIAGDEYIIHIYIYAVHVGKATVNCDHEPVIELCMWKHTYFDELKVWMENQPCV